MNIGQDREKRGDVDGGDAGIGEGDPRAAGSWEKKREGEG